jgi:hypothetical protein
MDEGLRTSVRTDGLWTDVRTARVRTENFKVGGPRTQDCVPAGPWTDNLRTAGRRTEDITTAGPRNEDLCQDSYSTN